MPFNQLTPAKAERLTLLAEECAEVIQAITKILRHGYDSYNPCESAGLSNRQHLEREIGHVDAAFNLMGHDISTNAVHKYSIKKSKEVKKYLHHQ